MKDDVIAKIKKDLQGASGDQKTAEDSVFSEETPVPFDVSSLSLQQLQQLKSVLASTPDGQKKKREHSIVRLKSIDAKIVVDFKNAFLALVDDPENNRKVERHVIPVRYNGEKDYHNIPYKQFIGADQVHCEVLSTRTEAEEYVEGTVFSREKGTNVELVCKKVTNYFTVQLPDKKTIEIEARVANS